jgi:hypothetical protein
MTITIVNKFDRLFYFARQHRTLYQGEGTREGTGKCNCDNGYEGDLCDECKDGFFEESKNDTHTKCTGMRKTSWMVELLTITD